VTRFHTLRVNEIRRETSDSVVIGFELPSALSERFQFTAGQYVTLRRGQGADETR
jgi:ring-1,2-phenylacetyl-CoA epoxidase subunit PaaE